MSNSVLIVDDRHDTLELNRILLEAEGYEAEGCSYSEATPDRLRRDRPAVVLLDLMPRDDAPWELLRRLRQDVAEEDIGVVVTSDSPVLVDRALRDQTLRVAAGLVMPFDIEALYAAIAAALHGQAPPVVPTNAFLERAAATLRRDRARVLQRWVQRLSALEVFRRQPDLPLAALQGQGQALLDGIVAALALQSSASPSSLNVATATVGSGGDAARAHARLRRAQGAGAGDLARETAALRREAWRAVRADADDGPSLGDVWDVLRRIDAAVDDALYAMLDVWPEGAGESKETSR